MGVELSRLFSLGNVSLVPSLRPTGVGGVLPRDRAPHTGLSLSTGSLGAARQAPSESAGDRSPRSTTALLSDLETTKNEVRITMASCQTKKHLHCTIPLRIYMR
jgi:hypothetical protein